MFILAVLVVIVFYHHQLAPYGFTTDSLTIGHYPLASRPTPHVALRWGQRGQVVRRPSPTGYCLTPTADLPKTERDPISTNGHSIIHYVTEPGNSCGKIKPFFPTRHRPTVDHSLVAGDAQRQWLQARLPDGHTAQCLFSTCSP